MSEKPAPTKGRAKPKQQGSVKCDSASEGKKAGLHRTTKHSKGNQVAGCSKVQPDVLRPDAHSEASEVTAVSSKEPEAEAEGKESQSWIGGLFSSDNLCEASSTVPASDVMAPAAEELKDKPDGHGEGGDIVSDIGTDAGSLTSFTSPSYVENLPDDVLLLVLGWLDIRTRVIIERVCHRWKALAERLWRGQCRLSFTGVFSISQGKPLTITILRALLSRCGESLRWLDLATASHMLDHKAVKAIGTRCPNLEYLDASGVQLTNTSVMQLANRCPKLKSVLLKDCCDVREKSLRRLLRRCRRLEHIDLTEMYEFTGECFNIDGLRLRHLILRGCTGLTSRGMSRIATKCTSLTELQLLDCFKISDHDLSLICQNLKSLKNLGLSRSLCNATSSGIGAIGNLRLLEHLDLSSNRTVDDASMGPIATGCKKLRFLDLTNCERGITDAAMSHIAKCSELRELKISYVEKITDAGMCNLACHGRLHSVEVRACALLSDAGVLAIVELCQDLRLLDLSGCEHVSSAAMESCAAIVAERPHVLTVIVGGTSVELGQLSTDSKGKLKIDYSDYCVESYLPGDMDFDYDDYWDQDLYDYEAGYEYWDSSDYDDDDELMVGDMLRPGAIFIDMNNMWDGVDVDDDLLDNEGPLDDPLDEPPEDLLDNNLPIDESPEDMLDNDLPLDEPPEDLLDNDLPLEEPPEESLDNDLPLEEPPEDSLDNEFPLDESPEDLLDDGFSLDEPPDDPLDDWYGPAEEEFWCGE
ncbi:putative RNA-binding protein EEED8.10 isoform X2 [Dermacentor albipictus]|uniref:putative RNA-binding protein EEED8.10 isoform X2 n=1 Tax=Dermacentor albipictus TaxID=60249 RepID=UPI0031FE0F8D